MGSVTDNTQQTATSNQAYVASSVIEKRLETQPLLDELENFLRGSRLIPHEVEGKGIIMKSVTTGTPKCNSEGVQSLMSFLQSIVNSQAVQGNLDRQQYDLFIYETNLSLVKSIVINNEGWAITDENIEVICDFMMSLIIPFMSRTIDDGERDSYEQTLRSIESNTVQQKRLPFGTTKG